MENVSQIQDNRYGISWVLPVEKSEFGNVAGPEGSGFRIFDALSTGCIQWQHPYPETDPGKGTKGTFTPIPRS